MIITELNIIEPIIQNNISLQDFLLGSSSILWTVFCFIGLFNSIFKKE